MARTLLAVLLGAAVHFFWGFLSWEILDLHKPSMGFLKNEETVVATISSGASEEKAYPFPGSPDGMTEKVKEKYRQGPIGWVFYNPTGMDPMSPQIMLNGFLLDVISTVMIVFVLIATLSSQVSYLNRLFVIVVMAIFAAVTTHLLSWNWAGFPWHWSVMNAADTVLGWTAAGLFIAALVKPNVPPPPVPAPARV
jgi:hypothetical protein